MKHLYYIFCLSILFCSSINSQTDLLGTWFLDYIVKDGVTYPNYFNDNQIFEITFTDDESGFEDYLNFNMGHGCSASNGIYNTNSNDLIVEITGTLAIDCLTRAYAQYETFFLGEFTYNDISSVHTYNIVGVSDDQVLTLVNPVNGNSLVFKKQAPTTLLISTWWLHQIDIPGNSVIDIPITDTPHITFTNTISDFPFIPEANGLGECESFFANYNVTFNGANNISISEVSQSLSGCATQTYEGIYFSILGDITSSFFEFEVINNGSTLILTDLLGAKLIFGDTTLSIDEQSIESLEISLKQNPIDNELLLDIDNTLLSKNIDYYIYSIEGKLIMSSQLNQESINVSGMQSGIYIINFTINNSNVFNLKFVKK